MLLYQLIFFGGFFVVKCIQQHVIVLLSFQRWARNVLCDVWVGNYFDDSVSRNFTAEWYFAAVSNNGTDILT